MCHLYFRLLVTLWWNFLYWRERARRTQCASGVTYISVCRALPSRTTEAEDLENINRKILLLTRSMASFLWMLRVIVATGLSCVCLCLLVRLPNQTQSRLVTKEPNENPKIQLVWRRSVASFFLLSFFYSSFYESVYRVCVLLNATMIAFSWPIPLNDPLIIIIIIIMHPLFGWKSIGTEFAHAFFSFVCKLVRRCFSSSCFGLREPLFLQTHDSLKYWRKRFRFFVRCVLLPFWCPMYESDKTT